MAQKSVKAKLINENIFIAKYYVYTYNKNYKTKQLFEGRKNMSSKKLISRLFLIIAVCMFLLGFIFKMTAKQYKGIATSTGISINGEYMQTDSGRLGANSEKYNTFNGGGNMFYVLSGVSIIVSVVMNIKDKKD